MGGNPPDAKTRIEMRVNMLASLLSLTDDQKSKALTIFTDAYNAGETARAGLQTARESLADAVKTNNTAAIDQLSGTVGTFTGHLTAIEAKAEAAFYALLTPEQRTKYDSMPRGGPGGRMGPDAFGPGPAGFRRGR